MRVHVSVQDIQDGDAGSGLTCPIAFALYRRFPKFEFNVGAASVSILNVNNPKTYRLPMVARKFVANFDAGLIVKPFYFKLSFRPK